MVKYMLVLGKEVYNLCEEVSLKEYYEIIDEARPLSWFFPTHADFVYGNTFLIMKLSNPPSFRAIRALIASQSTFEI